MNLDALWDLTYGLYILTSFKGDKLNGQIVNSVVQVTAEPVRFAVSINKANLTHSYIRESGFMALCVLEQDAPMPLIGTFGFKSGFHLDKFADVAYHTGQTGCPLLSDHSLSSLEMRVIDELDAGTHTVFLTELEHCEIIKQAVPMTYAYYRDVKHGKASKNAPTYKGDDVSKTVKKEEGMKYVCTICGYVYDPAEGDADAGIAAGTTFEDLPEDWVCPICGAGKDDFEPQD